MMKKRVFIITLEIFFLFVLTVTGTQIRGEEIDTFRLVKKVHIEIKESYDEAINVNLPFEEIVNKFLKYAGAKVVRDNYDAILRITVEGKALGASYTPGRIRLYTGSRVSGKIAFEIINGKRVIERSFSGQVPPPFSANISNERLRKPEGAPFLEAMKVKGSFCFSLAKMIGEIYGLETLTLALRDEDPFFGWNAAWALEEIKGPSSR
jgi:hypothetical protein